MKKHYPFRVLKNGWSFFKKSPLLIFLALITLANNLLLTWSNGWQGCVDNTCGLVFIKELYHDPIWHLALSAVAFNTFPFQMPIMAGEQLMGYHYFFDLLVFIIGKLGIPLMNIYWHINPIIYSVLFIYLVVKVGKAYLKTTWGIALFFFLAQFGGSFSFIPSLIHNGVLWGAGTPSLLQSNTIILGPHIAYSYLCVLAGMLLLAQKYSLRNALYLGICTFLAFGFKFYAGMVLLSMVGVYELLHMLKKRDVKTFMFRSAIIVVSTAIAIIVFYNPFSSIKTGSPFIFNPLATVHPIIEYDNLYPLKNVALMRYALAGDWTSPRLIFIETFTIGLFLFHHFGVRLIGLMYGAVYGIKRKLKIVDMSLFAGAFIGTIMPILFIQKGEWWNSMQFMYYPALIFSLYTARLLVPVIKKIPTYASATVFLVIVAISIPDTIDKLLVVYGERTVIPHVKIEALQYLKKQPAGAVFTVPIRATSSYIPVLSHKPVYFADRDVIKITGVEFAKRESMLETTALSNPELIPVRYWYLEKSDADYTRYLIAVSKNSSMKKIFDNNEIILFTHIEYMH